jgi:hypothetical protein
LITAFAREHDAGQELGARVFYIGVCRREIGFGFADVRTLSEKLGREAWCHARIGDAAQAAAANCHAFGRAGHQHGKRDPVLAQRLLERRDGSALRVDQAFLLGSVERGCCARLKPLLNQVEHARRAGKVFARNAQTILRGQYLEIGVGGGDYGGEGDDLAIEPAGDRCLFSSAQSRAVLAPEIDLVTCAEHGREVVVDDLDVGTRPRNVDDTRAAGGL